VGGVRDDGVVVVHGLGLALRLGGVHLGDGGSSFQRGLKVKRSKTKMFSISWSQSFEHCFFKLEDKKFVFKTHYIAFSWYCCKFLQR
jgi:hypothetical protein